MGFGIPIYKFTVGVEVQLTAIGNGTIIQLPDNPILREPNVLIESVETYVSGTNGLAKTPGGLTVVTPSGGTGLMLNLVDDKNQQRVFNHPYLAFNAPANQGVSREFEPFKIVMQKSSVQVSDSTNLTIGQAIYVVFIYSVHKNVAPRK